MVSGLVVSTTINSGDRASLPNTRWKTSGARLLPPIPSSTACRKPAWRTSSVSASSSPTRSSIVS